MTRLSASGRKASLAFTACWAIPGAACSGLVFVRGFWPAQPGGGGIGGPGIPGPAGAVLFLCFMAGAVLWLAAPVILIVAGTAQLRATGAGWQWPALWGAVVAAGIMPGAYGAAGWSILSGSGFSWHWLIAAAGYLAAGAALAAILLAAPRAPGLQPAPAA